MLAVTFGLRSGYLGTGQQGSQCARKQHTALAWSGFISQIPKSGFEGIKAYY